MSKQSSPSLLSRLTHHFSNLLPGQQANIAFFRNTKLLFQWHSKQKIKINFWKFRVIGKNISSLNITAIAVIFWSLLFFDIKNNWSIYAKGYFHGKMWYSKQYVPQYKYFDPEKCFHFKKLNIAYQKQIKINLLKELSTLCVSFEIATFLHMLLNAWKKAKL